MNFTFICAGTLCVRLSVQIHLYSANISAKMMPQGPHSDVMVIFDQNGLFSIHLNVQILKVNK